MSKRYAHPSTMPVNTREDITAHYGSFRMQLFEIGQESATICELIRNVFATLFNSSVISFFLFTSTILAAIMCYVGLVYVNKCPAIPEIPLYLLVGGSVGLLQISLLMMRHRREQHEDIDDDTRLAAFGVRGTRPQQTYSSTSTRVAESIFWLFLLGWFVVGNFWVFKIFLPPPRQHERSDNPTFWCAPYVYNLALGQIAVTHAILIMTVLLTTLLTCCVRFVMMDGPMRTPIRHHSRTSV
uniref:DUF202 domain-containing protein n=1 Tax=Panagrellus redivivus TaxID=6233 RepID=A0A7E4ZT41_PANRE